LSLYEFGFNCVYIPRLSLWLFLFLWVPNGTSANDVPIDRDFLNLPGQRWVWLEKTGWHSTRVILGKGKKSFENRIWFKEYETGRDDRNHTWAYAFFVKIKPNRFIDLDEKRNLRIAVSTHDIGTNVISYALIYKVGEKSLEVESEIPGFNTAADESVYR
jgi:hypothetical protein